MTTAPQRRAARPKTWEAMERGRAACMRAMLAAGGGPLRVLDLCERTGLDRRMAGRVAALYAAEGAWVSHRGRGRELSYSINRKAER